MSTTGEERRGVVLIAGSFPPRICGVGDYTAQLARHLSEAGAPVAVWTKMGETEPAPGVHPIVTGWDRAGVRDLIHKLRLARPHVVHLQYERSLFDHNAAVTVLLPELLRALGIPLVTTFHALEGPQGWGKAHRAALLPLVAHSANVVVASPRQQAALSRFPGVRRKVHLLPIGSGIEPMATHTPRPASGEPVLLIYFGFLWPGRNGELLLKALAALPRGSATLDMIGGIRDTAYRAELERLASSLGVVDRVTFSGELSEAEISHRLAGADVALLPFATGASVGRSSLAAALAHHLPVVTLSVPENLSPDFRDGENLLLTQSGDEEAFIASVKRIVEDASLRVRLSEGAARLSEDVFAWPKIATHTLALPAYRAITTS